MQIKEIDLRSIDFDHDCGQFIAKSISNNGKLKLWDCKMTKPGYDAFSVELGDKQVINAEKCLKKLMIDNKCFETLLMYEKFFNKIT